MPRQTKEDIAKLKQEYIEYYEEVPVQKYAAMAIGRTEETIINWRRDDEDFSNQVDQAKAKWVKKNVAKSKAEFALERLERDIFAPPKQQLEHSGSDPIKILVEKYGIKEELENDRKDDGVVPGTSESSA